MYLGYSQDQWILAFATGIGAYGGFPPAPKAFQNFAQSELAQWFLVFVLLYQGGAGQNVEFALQVTCVMYILHKYALNQ
jgi:hypothetical protein